MQSVSALHSTQTPASTSHTPPSGLHALVGEQPIAQTLLSGLQSCPLGQSESERQATQVWVGTSHFKPLVQSASVSQPPLQTAPSQLGASMSIGRPTPALLALAQPTIATSAARPTERSAAGRKPAPARCGAANPRTRTSNQCEERSQ